MQLLLNNRQYKLTLTFMLFLALYTTLVFEVLAPLTSPVYVRDPVDALCYLLGAIFYYYVHQPRVFL